MDRRAFSIALDGATIEGEMRGEGPTLVLVHGVGARMADWDGLLDHLPPDLSLLRYDLRGFGRSKARDGQPFSHSEDLRAVLDRLGIGRASVLGASMGGAIALNLALNHPGRVDRLVLLSPGMVGWTWSEEWIARWRRITGAARSGDIALARRLWWEHPLFDSVRHTAAADELRASIQAYHGQQWIRDDQRRELPDIDRLHELSMPTLLLTGERDMPDFRLIADVLEAAAPGIERMDFAGAGHMLALERPEEVARAIEAFLQEGSQR